MWFFCCTRTTPPGGEQDPGAEAEGDHACASSSSSSRRRSPSRLSGTAGGKRRSVAPNGLADAEQFDEAVEKDDLNALVRLLDSTQPIRLTEQMHPWAANPRSVGSLAGTRLAMLAHGGRNRDIAKAGAIPSFVKFLTSTEVDRIQAAVVALSFLTACQENAVEAFASGALPPLLSHMDAEEHPPGMRSAAATTLRHICMESNTAREEFVSSGGLEKLVRQLGLTPEDFPNYADIQLETMLNLQDMIEDEDNRPVPSHVRAVLEAGAEAHLWRVVAWNDAEEEKCLDGTSESALRFTVMEVLQSLGCEGQHQKLERAGVRPTVTAPGD